MSFFAGRKDWNYYRRVCEILAGIGRRRSILDVGSWDSPVATWGDFEVRYTLDIRSRPALHDVTAIYGLWPQASSILRHPVSVITCLQVIEHVEDAGAFCGALLAQGDCIVVSVPWKWPRGFEESHVHDPVDDVKMLGWFGRDPLTSEIVEDGRVSRLISIYQGIGSTPSTPSTPA